MAAAYVATTVATSSSGATTERSSRSSAPSTSSRMSGRISCRSLGGVLLARRSPRRRRRRRGCRRSRRPRRGRRARSAARASLPGAASGTASIWATPLPGAGDARGVDAVDLLDRGEDLLGVVAGERPGSGRWCRPGTTRRAARRRRWPRAARGTGRPGRGPVVMPRAPMARTARRDERADDERARPAGDRVADPVPHDRVGVDEDRVADVRHARPEHPAAEEHQRRRQHDEGERRGDHDADGAREAQPASRRDRPRAAG